MGVIKNSGDIITTGVVTAKPSKYWGMSLWASSDDVTAVLNDNPEAASGNVVDRAQVDFSTQPSLHINLSKGIPAPNGIFITLTGTNPKANVRFEPL